MIFKIKKLISSIILYNNGISPVGLFGYLFLFDNKKIILNQLKFQISSLQINTIQVDISDFVITQSITDNGITNETVN